MFKDSPECREQWCEFAATAWEHVFIENNVRRALRVLNALAVQHDVDASDVAELQRIAPLLAGAPLDVLAWGVLEQVLKDRSLVGSDPCQPIDITT